MLTILFFALCMCSSTLCEVSDVGCGITKTCWKWPSGCNLASNEDCRFVSWNVSTTTDDFFFEMWSNQGSNRYHGFGIARDQGMPNADVYICRESSMAFGSTTAKALPNFNQTNAGITQVSAGLINGSLQCTFTRVRNITREISGGQNYQFDLIDTSYYIIMSVGDVNLGQIVNHGSTNRVFSSGTFNFSEPLSSPVITTQPAVNVTTQPAVNVTTSPSATTQNDATTTAAETISRTGCETTKSCYSNVADCRLQSKSCRFLSWKKVGSYIEFEMSGSMGNGEEYLAMAIGTTNKMQDADTYICNGKNVTSAVITTRHIEPTYLKLVEGMYLVKASTIGQVAKCVFRRPITVTKVISSGNHTFDLNTREYYLLLASGLTNGDKIMQHNWRIVAEDKYNFTLVPGSGNARIFPCTIVLFGLLGITSFVQSRLMF